MHGLRALGGVFIIVTAHGLHAFVQDLEMEVTTLLQLIY
jgi:hypothetical protein